MDLVSDGSDVPGPGDITTAEPPALAAFDAQRRREIEYRIADRHCPGFGEFMARRALRGR